MRVAFIVQRCGQEVVGGSESLCLDLARHLGKEIDIEIITTCAKDYVTWRNEYPEGLHSEDGVNIRRFPVKRERDPRFNALYGKMRRFGTTGRREQLRWMKYQGPYSPSLIKHLQNHNNDYDLLVFFTYLYYTTFHGITVEPERSVLIPTAHDEPPIYYDIFKDVFNSPKGIIFLTPEERDFVHKKFANERISSEVIGMGIPIPEPVGKEAAGKLGVQKPYVLYFGRIDEAKGCAELFDFFQRYKEAHPGDLRLVLFGADVMGVPDSPDIKYLGRLSEKDKLAVIAGSEVVIQPSSFESFSINTLEAMAQKVPVLVNGASEVLKGHSLRSEAGLIYNDFYTFDAGLSSLLSDQALRETMGSKGYRYVKENYDWNVITEKYVSFLKRMAE